MASRMPRVEEQAALEVIRAVEDVVSHRWLEEGSVRTPDLEVVLGDDRVVRAEITMSAKSPLFSCHGLVSDYTDRDE